MMKKIILFVAITVNMFACNDKLELEPWQQISTDVALATIEDFEIAVNGIYAEMRDGNNTTGAFGSFHFIWPDVAADNLILCRTGRLSYQTVQNWTYSSSYFLANNMFAAIYDAINNANLVITNIENFATKNDEDEVLRKHLYGEALAVRALLHFELIKIYAKSYSQADASDLGVPYMKVSEVSEPSRPTVISNYQDLVTDLTTALENITIDNGATRLSPATVHGILAKVYFEMANYSDAITQATIALNDIGIASLANFPDVWLDQSNDGVMFKVRIEEKDNMLLGNDYSQTSDDGVKSEYVVDYDLFQLYQANDIRRSSYFLNATFDGNSYNAINKYMGRPGASPNLVDLKILRAADVLLVRAESYHQTGDYANAEADLNTLKAQRYTGFVPGPTPTPTALLTEIRLERRLELAFEGDRFFELKRLGLPVSRNGNNGDLADGSGQTYDFLSLPLGDPHWVMPIPINEMNANSNMVQNPDY